MAQQQLRPGWILRVGKEAGTYLKKKKIKKIEIDMYIYISHEGIGKIIPPPLSFPATGCSHLHCISTACPNFLLCCFYSQCILAFLANFKEAAPGVWSLRRLCLPGAITLQHNFILRSVFHTKQWGKTLSGVWWGWEEGKGAVPEGGMEGDGCALGVCITF